MTNINATKIRSSVCTIANRYTAQGFSKSESFKMAWSEVKNPTPALVIDMAYVIAAVIAVIITVIAIIPFCVSHSTRNASEFNQSVADARLCVATDEFISRIDETTNGESLIKTNEFNENIHDVSHFIKNICR